LSHAEGRAEDLPIPGACHAAARGEVDDPRTFPDLLGDRPELLDKNLLLAYYSPERLASAEARSSWVEPDRRSLTSDFRFQTSDC
jgi:hypothetical protein